MQTERCIIERSYAETPKTGLPYTLRLNRDGLFEKLTQPEQARLKPLLEKMPTTLDTHLTLEYYEFLNGEVVTASYRYRSPAEGISADLIHGTGATEGKARLALLEQVLRLEDCQDAPLPKYPPYNKASLTRKLLRNAKEVRQNDPT
jgi:hypothetical protein